MNLRACIFAAIGVLIAFLHYALFKGLVLAAITCQLTNEPCSVSATHSALMKVLGFPLWYLPASFFSSLPGVSNESAEPLYVQAALNACVWGVGVFVAQLFLFPRPKSR
jgi:hypothetical protein